MTGYVFTSDVGSLTDTVQLDYYTKVCVSDKRQGTEAHITQRYNIVGKVVTT